MSQDGNAGTVARHIALLSEGFRSSNLALVANIATICSVIVYLSPVGDMYNICLRGYTGATRPMPFLLLLCAALLWTYYGFLMEDAGILRINAVGAFVSFVFCAILGVYANPGKRKNTLFLYIIAFSCVAVFLGIVDTRMTPGSVRENLVGYVASLVSISVSLPPLLDIARNLHDLDMEGFPTGLVICCFISSVLWGQYSIMIASVPFLIPNLVGVILYGGQLALLVYTKYKECKKRRRRTAREVLTNFVYGMSFRQRLSMLAFWRQSSSESAQLLRSSGSGESDMALGERDDTRGATPIPMVPCVHHRDITSHETSTEEGPSGPSSDSSDEQRSSQPSSQRIDDRPAPALAMKVHPPMMVDREDHVGVTPAS